MTFAKGHTFYPRKAAYVRPHDIPGAVIHKVAAPPPATAGNVWGIGAADDTWGGTFRDPFDITASTAPKIHPWSII